LEHISTVVRSARVHGLLLEMGHGPLRAKVMQIATWLSTVQCAWMHPTATRCIAASLHAIDCGPGWRLGRVIKSMFGCFSPVHDNGGGVMVAKVGVDVPSLDS
jgi:hypothetical protein